MPEFLTEKNYQQDFINNKLWIFGTPTPTPIPTSSPQSQSSTFKQRITNLINLAHKNKKILHNNIKWMTNKEAELVKYFRNTFLAVKVSYCNEIYEYCEKQNIDYNTIVNVAASDSRIGLSHTMVPGPDGKFGFGGTCFPKDTNGLLYDMNRVGVESYVLKSAIERNEKKDRSEKDWNTNKGRAVI